MRFTTSTIFAALCFQSVGASTNLDKRVAQFEKMLAELEALSDAPQKSDKVTDKSDSVQEEEVDQLSDFPASIVKEFTQGQLPSCGHVAEAGLCETSALAVRACMRSCTTKGAVSEQFNLDKFKRLTRGRPSFCDPVDKRNKIGSTYGVKAPKWTLCPDQATIQWKKQFRRNYAKFG